MKKSALFSFLLTLIFVSCNKDSTVQVTTTVLVTVNDLIDTEWENSTEVIKNKKIVTTTYYFETGTDVRQCIRENIALEGIEDTVIVISDKLLKYKLNYPNLTIGEEPLSFKFDSKYKFHSLDDNKVYKMFLD